MSSESTHESSAPGQQNRRLVLAGVGVAVVALGTLTPMLTPGPPEPPAPAVHAVGDPAEFPGLDEAAPMPDVQSVLTRLVVGTGVVLGLCVLALWGCKRWLKPAELPAGGGQLRVLEVLRVARTRVYLVQARDQKFLAGVDASGIKTVVALPPRPDLAAAGEA